MQFGTRTARSPLLESITRYSQLVKPGIAPNIPDVANKCVPCLDQRGTITFMVPAVPSMFEEHTDLEIMLGAKVTRTRVKLMKL